MTEEKKSEKTRFEEFRVTDDGVIEIFFKAG